MVGEVTSLRGVAAGGCSEVNLSTWLRTKHEIRSRLPNRSLIFTHAIRRFSWLFVVLSME